MLMSQLLGERYKEKPVEATMNSHIFLLRGGYIRQVAAGIYSLLPPAKRVTAKIERIIREEMDAIDGQEVLFPVVMPAEIWRESGRYDSIGSEMMRMTDRGGHDMVLGMTHEEASVHLARTEATSYTRYPFMIYQIQTKFRDEPRCRAGLIRVREFTMKDAYSFHTSQEDLAQYYDRAHAAYERIFRRAGLKNVISVKSDTGMMGGSIAHEFMFTSSQGEDSLVLCPTCGYRANVEVAPVSAVNEERPLGVTAEVATPDTKTIEELCELLSTTAERTVKACVFAAEGRREPIVVFIRGDYEVNEAKLRRAVGTDVFPLTEGEDCDLCMGFIGPVGLKTSAKVYFDASLKGCNDMLCGANKKDTHLKGVNITAEELGELWPEEFLDLAKARQGDLCPVCGKPLDHTRGIEVGNIFQLGTKYSASMGMTYTDADGSRKTPIMGCYGIGVGRLLACIIEECCDNYGPIWPISVAPWQVHICAMGGGKDAVVKDAANDVYARLSKEFEVLYDDRDLTAGVTFADADLLGVPIRVVVGKRGLANGEVELRTRDGSINRMVPLAELEKAVNEVKKELYERIGG